MGFQSAERFTTTGASEINGQPAAADAVQLGLQLLILRLQALDVPLGDAELPVAAAQFVAKGFSSAGCGPGWGRWGR